METILAAAAAVAIVNRKLERDRAAPTRGIKRQPTTGTGGDGA